jgi:hypothetical protein
MIAWMAHRIMWFVVRAAVTLACDYTIWNLINSNGYRVEFKNLLLASVCAIVAIRIWMPSCSCQRDKNNHG